jgi:hypothetical protein
VADIIFENVRKDYQMGEVTIRAADDVSFQVRNGELMFFLGLPRRQNDCAQPLGGMIPPLPEKSFSRAKTLPG